MTLDELIRKLQHIKRAYPRAGGQDIICLDLGFQVQMDSGVLDVRYLDDRGIVLMTVKERK